MRTIRSTRDIDAIFRDSKRVAHPLVIALISPIEPGRGPGGRVAFVAGKKLGNAVKRNRSKRVLRDSARRQGAPWAGFDVVLIAREGTGHAAHQELDSAIAAVVARGGLLDGR